MKSLMFVLALVSFNAFADFEVYVGQDNGETCTFRYAPDTQRVSMGEYTFTGRKVKELEGNVLLLEGGVDFFDGKMFITFDQKKVPVAAKLQIRNPLFPIFLTKVDCKDLVRVK